MWKIIKAAFSNEKFKIALVYLICLACFLAIWFGVKWERNRNAMTLLIMLMTTFFATYSGEIPRIEQKRDRLHAQLPVSIYQIGMAHLFFPVCIWFSIYALFHLSRFGVQIFYPEPLSKPDFLQILMLNGMILFINALFLLNRDIKAVTSSMMLKLLTTVLFSVSMLGCILPFYIVTNTFNVFGENTWLQKWLNQALMAPSWSNALGFTFAGFSLLVFSKRKNYISS